VVSQLGAVAMVTTDTIMVAPLGAEPLAAAGLGSSLQSFVLMLCIGVLMGMIPLVSQAFGAGDRARCRQALVAGQAAALLLSIPLFLFLYNGRALALLLGQEPEVAELGGAFMRALAWSAWPVLSFSAFRQYLEGMGVTKPTMVMTFVGIAVNVAGNRVLIHGAAGVVPPLGIVGAGISTTLVRCALLVVMVAYLLAHRELNPFRGTRWRPDGRLLRQVFTIGVPVGVQNGAEVGIFSFASVMMGWMGATEQAAHQVTINLAATTFMVALGVSLAGSIRVGQHVGAGSQHGVRRSVAAAYVVTMAFMTLCALLFLLAPRGLIGLYTHDAAIVQVGTSLLFMAALFQLFDGAQAAGLCALRGAADTRVPMLLTVLGYWFVGFPVAYLLGFHTRMGPTGVWAGLVVSLAVVAVLLAFRVRRVLWNRPVRALAA
jgi:MATE family multidrug resistance protein